MKAWSVKRAGNLSLRKMEPKNIVLKRVPWLRKKREGCTVQEGPTIAYVLIAMNRLRVYRLLLSIALVSVTNNFIGLEPSFSRNINLTNKKAILN